MIVRTHPEDGFALRADTLLAAITPRTRGIIINSPGNPTGALMAETELASAGRSGAPRGIWIVLDLCYDKLIYDPVAAQPASACWRGTMRDHSVLCGSASKVYAMTGWRCGWAVGPAALIARVQRDPEPLDLERLLDHAEGGRGGAERTAGVRHRDARRVPPPPRSAVRVAVGGAAHPAASSRPARSTCSPTSREFLSPDGYPHVRRARDRRCSTRRTWRSRPARRSTRRASSRISYATSMKELRARHRAHPRVRRGRWRTGSDRVALPLRVSRRRSDLGRRPGARPHRRRVTRQLRHRRAEARHVPPTSSCCPERTADVSAIVRLCARASRAARAARRRHRLHRRRGADARRRRPLARAHEPHPRDRRGEPRRRRRAQRHHRRPAGRRREGRPLLSARPRVAAHSRSSAATSPSAPAGRARSSTARRSSTCSASRPCCRPATSSRPAARSSRTSSATT